MPRDGGKEVRSKSISYPEVIKYIAGWISASSMLNCRVESLEFDSGVLDLELPIDSALFVVSPLFTFLLNSIQPGRVLGAGQGGIHPGCVGTGEAEGLVDCQPARWQGAMRLRPFLGDPT